jgi:hypothetical protein
VDRPQDPQLSVPSSIATRKPCTLKATERGVPPQYPFSSSGSSTLGIGGEVGQGDRLLAAHHAATGEHALGHGASSSSAARDRIRGQRGRGGVRGAAGDDGAGRAEGAGVVRHQIGVGLAQPATRVVVCSTVAAICWCTVDVPLPNSAVPTSSPNAPSASSRIVACEWCPRGGTVAIIATADPSPTRQPAARRIRPLPRARQAVAHEPHALVEAVAADDEVGLLVRGDHRVVRSDEVRRAERADPPSRRASSSTVDSIAKIIWLRP